MMYIWIIVSFFVGCWITKEYYDSARFMYPSGTDLLEKRTKEFAQIVDAKDKDQQMALVVW